jgi:hypothetical protein
MRFFTLAVVAFAVACGSVSSNHDGGAGGAGGAAGAGGSGGVICTLGGVGHPAGTTFPSPDGCNSCTCTLDGLLACTERACPPDAGTDCAFDATYSYGNTGGLAIYEDDVTLTPPASYTHTRHPTATTPPDISCAPALPSCNTANLIDVADVMRDIADPDVQSILSTGAKPGPVLGYDSRPVDGQVFKFVRSDGVGFFVGSPCAAGTTAQCVPIPIGVATLVADLRSLDTQQLKDAGCAALR